MSTCYYDFYSNDVATEHNYLQERVFKAKPCRDLYSTIHFVKIFNKVMGKVFHNTYQVDISISDNRIKRSHVCYRGYDVASICTTVQATTKLNTIKLDSTLQSTLVNLDAGGDITTVRQIMRSAGISRTVW